MTKKEIIAAVAAATENSVNKTKEIVDTTFSMIANVLKYEKVEIAGIGTFSVVDKAERQGRNLHTGETMTIPAHKSVKFKPTPGLNKSVNE